MRHTAVTTRIGEVWLSYDCLPDGPAVLLIHGAMRAANDLFDFGQRIKNCVYGHLPGHSVPNLTEMSVDAWSKAFAVAAAEFFQERPVLVVGESLGGLVAIGIARFPIARIHHVVAIDPPLSPMPWPLATAALTPSIRSLFEHDHWPLLEAARIPVTIVAGSEDLGQQRDADRSPSLMSDIDKRRASIMSTLHVIPGGHLLLQENPDACEQILLQLMQQV